MKTKSIKCNFKNSRGHTLDARLDTPKEVNASELNHFIIFCHCFTCSKETITTFRLSRLLAEKGYGVVLNPVKSESIVFEGGDKIIVLAEA